MIRKYRGKITKRIDGVKQMPISTTNTTLNWNGVNNGWGNTYSTTSTGDYIYVNYFNERPLDYIIQDRPAPVDFEKVKVVEKEVIKYIEKEGVWKDTDRDIIVCSECDFELPYVRRTARYKYCPYCGAKMKPEE